MAAAPLRLMTFNTYAGATLERTYPPLDLLARQVQELAPDVLALQEVDVAQPRSGMRDLTGVLAEAMGATHVRFAAALLGSDQTGWRRGNGEDRGAPAFGNALLSRLPALGWSVQQLPLLQRPPVLTQWPRGLGWLRDEARVALTATVDLPGGDPLTVTTTHLSKVPGWNVAQVQALRRQHGGWPRRTVLLGDLNMTATRARHVRGLRPLVEAATHPSDRPTSQLDHVLATPDVTMAAPGRAVRLDVSDHRALVVDVRVR